jgi:uncharacterized protein
LSDIICDTSPIQYLHQIGQLSLLPALAGNVIVPPYVVRELEVGMDLGINLPDIRVLNWITVRSPLSVAALPLVKDLGPGETQVLALALELPNAVVILDDNLARQVARSLDISLMGTLGVLLDAKRARMIPAITPMLDQLQALSFRLGSNTRYLVLKMAGEID